MRISVTSRLIADRPGPLNQYETRSLQAFQPQIKPPPAPDRLVIILGRHRLRLTHYFPRILSRSPHPDLLRPPEIKIIHVQSPSVPISIVCCSPLRFLFKSSFLPPLKTLPTHPVLLKNKLHGLRRHFRLRKKQLLSEAHVNDRFRRSNRKQPIGDSPTDTEHVFRCATRTQHFQRD